MVLSITRKQLFRAETYVKMCVPECKGWHSRARLPAQHAESAFYMLRKRAGIQNPGAKRKLHVESMKLLAPFPCIDLRT